MSANVFDKTATIVSFAPILDGQSDANIVADDSFRVKRIKARPHGRAARILRRFCHVTVVVSDDRAEALR